MDDFDTKLDEDETVAADGLGDDDEFGAGPGNPGDEEMETADDEEETEEDL